jgi:hypothetical protein
MNEKNINDLVLFLVNTIKESKDFVLGQAPSVLNEILIKEIVLDWVWFSIGLFFILLNLFILIKFGRKILDDMNGNCDWSPPLIVCLVVSGFVSIMMFLINMFALISVYLAPKVFLLEYLNNLVRR